MRRRIIGVMGPGDGGPALEREAFALGALIARERWVLLTGGRAAGVMDAASRGAKSVADSVTVGILPDDCAFRNVIFARWREVCRGYGFVEWDAPVLEPTELYKKKSGPEIVHPTTRLLLPRT